MGRTRGATALKLVDPDHQLELGKIEDFANDLSDAHLQCREMNHRWSAFTAGRHEDGGYVRVLRCTRCYAKKHQDLSPRGMVMRSWYTYPEGYLTKDIGRIVGEGRGVLRLASVLRTINKKESADAS